jgi:hypothetical protein
MMTIALILTLTLIIIVRINIQVVTKAGEKDEAKIPLNTWTSTPGSNLGNNSGNTGGGLTGGSMSYLYPSYVHTDAPVGYRGYNNLPTSIHQHAVDSGFHGGSELQRSGVYGGLYGRREFTDLIQSSDLPLSSLMTADELATAKASSSSAAPAMLVPVSNSCSSSPVVGAGESKSMV